MTKKFSVAFHICPDALFSFSKIYFFGLLRGGGGGGGGGGVGGMLKGQKNVQNDKKFCLTSYLRNCISYDCDFWYTCPAIMSTCTHLPPTIFFHFFQNFDFLGFSKFISKCQKETLRWALWKLGNWFSSQISWVLTV